jgi:arsenite methyltransferase
MEKPNEIRETVRRKYGAIAAGESCCGSLELTSIAESYDGLAGHEPGADLNLGCGLPTAFAGLAAGETVVDLGSGAGNDAFVAARAVGPAGRVIGIDMTPEMIAKAQANRDRLGAGNVEFRLGEIEDLPLPDSFADVVISNCVLNLVPDKARAFAEIARILKPGGRFTVSDVVIEHDLPEPVRRSAEAWAGCVAGAMKREEYFETAMAAAFDLTVDRERPIVIPSEALPPEARGFDVAITSITLTGRKRPNEIRR